MNFKNLLNALFIMKKLILLFLTFCYLQNLEAQSTVTDPLKSIDIRSEPTFKRFSVGLATGIEQTAFQFNQFNLDTIAAQAKSFNGKSITGFTLGLSTRTRFSKNWDLLVDFAALFKDRSLSFNPADKGTAIGSFKLNEYHIPMHVRYTFDRFRIKPNIYTGGEVDWRVNSTAGDASFNGNASFVDIGVGFQFKIWKITLNPGFSYAFGINNLLKPGNSVFVNAENILKQNKFGVNLHIF